jgi:hypothetical protein
MHVPINVKSPNNISEWKMGFNSAFKGLTLLLTHYTAKCAVIDVTDSSGLCTIVDLKMARLNGSKHVVRK